MFEAAGSGTTLRKSVNTKSNARVCKRVVSQPLNPPPPYFREPFGTPKLEFAKSTS